jgi:hypothetical protein
MSADKKPKKKAGPVTLTGKVVLKPYSPGSKSEHDAVFLETDSGSFLLRRIGGNPFHDEVLHKWVGQNVKATGMLDKNLLLAKDIKGI